LKKNKAILAREEWEDQEDIRAYDEAKARMEEEGEESLVEFDELCCQVGLSPLRYLRGRAGLNQSQLARKSGLSQSYIARVEKNQRKLSLAAAKKIARVLGLPREKLLV